MSETCTIEFEDNPSKTLYSGKLVHGSVRLVIKSEKKVRGVYVKFTGEAYAAWTEERSCIKGDEFLLDKRVYLIGGDHSGINNIRLPPGMYQFKFQSYLPQQLPTTMKGLYGNINYKAVVVLDDAENLKNTNEEFATPITIVKSFDLNCDMDTSLCQPAYAEECQTFTSCFLLGCCTSSGAIKITASTPISAYAPGQVINLKFIVDNKSSKNISKFTVQLKHKIVYEINSISMYETGVNIEGETIGCDAGEHLSFCVNITVPTVPPSDNTTCRMIKTFYYIRILGSVEGWLGKLKLHLPITIGTSPILNVPAISTEFLSAKNEVIQNQPIAKF